MEPRKNRRRRIFAKTSLGSRTRRTVSVARGLAMLDEAAVGGTLKRYQPYWATRADFLGRLGETQLARKCYELAIRLSENDQEQEFLRSKSSDLAKNRM